MRPPSTLDDTPSRLRKPSSDLTHTNPEPTTLVLARESELVRVSTRSSTASAQEQGPLRTLKQTLEEIGATGGGPTHKTTSGSRGHSRRRSTVRPQSIDTSRQETSRQHVLPKPASGLWPSLPCSPKSLSARSMPNSEDYLTQDEGSSQVLETDDEEEEEDYGEDPTTSSAENSAPQLIMPSIHIPSRRPFTSRGESLGRVKIMLAGSQGSGKTSLIKSIVQLCEDIVHIDPVSNLTFARQQSTQSSSSTSPSCTEIYASSRPYPKWWNTLDDNRKFKRRKSMGDQVLDRNICFVDTQTQPVAKLERYMEEQLLRIIDCADKSVNELVGLMTGSGGGQVDLVLYLITPATIDQDIDQIRRLSELSNVVPVIAKSDQMTTEQIAELKEAIPRDICPIPQLPVNFGTAVGLPATALAPYTISSTNGPDSDNMDASLLMSSEYVEPLVTSELSLLVDELFTPENAAFLRHLAAKKLVTWHNTRSKMQKSASPSIAASPASIPRSPSPPSLAMSGILVPLTSELSFATSTNLSLAHIVDNNNDLPREERLAQVRLSKWTSDLQKTMQRDRLNLTHSPPFWLALDKHKQPSIIAPSQSQFQSHPNTLARISSNEKHALNHSPAASIYQIHDPLGLMAWQDILRQQGWLTLQLIGTFGVMGGLAVWVARTWRLEDGIGEWAFGRWVE